MRLSCTRNEDDDDPAFNSFLICLSDYFNMDSTLIEKFEVVTKVFLASSIRRVYHYFNVAIQPVSPTNQSLSEY
jgi:phage shock protein PspC (stress-responsive transcriptional regulator)